MRLSLRKKLYSSFLIIIILFLITVGISTTLSQRIVGLTQNILNSEETLESVQRLNLFARTANDDGAHYLLASSQMKDSFKVRYEADLEYLDKELVRLEVLISDLEGQERVNDFKTKWTQYIEETQATMELMAQGQETSAELEFTSHSFDPIAFSLLALVKDEQAQIEQYEQQIRDSGQTIQIVNYTSTGVTILITIGIVLFLSNYLVSRIGRLKVQAETVANGDLAIAEVDFKGEDELKDLAIAFNTMTQSLRSVITNADEVSIQVAASSVQLQASAQQTSAATDHIATITQEISYGIERQVGRVSDNMKDIQQLSQNVRQISDKSQIVLETVNVTTQTASQGKNELLNAIIQVKVIEDSNDKISRIIEVLNQQTAQIGQAVQIIMHISKQTDMLALNAGIEAARAGEHGRSFSVVAGEVRKLAEQTRKSADQISDLISGIQQEVGTAVIEMKQGTLEVQKGIQLIEEAGQSFEGIMGLIEDVQHDVQEVTKSTVTIMEETDRVVSGITCISDIGKENAMGTQSVVASTQEQLASMEEIAASSTSLADLAEILSELIGKFNVTKV